MDFELIFLGSGTSAGVPMIGCNCPVCKSDDPHDRRTRPSLLVRYKNKGANANQKQPQEITKNHLDSGAGVSPAIFQKAGETPTPPAPENYKENGWHNFLIDTSPELRQQAIRHNINHINAVFYTHAHADHILGIDDLRRFNVVMGKPLDLYGEKNVLAQLRGMFEYIFAPHKNINKSFVAKLITNEIEINKSFDMFGAIWTPLRLMHGRLPIAGYRIDYAGKSLAYCTDVSKIPPETFPYLQDLDVLIIDALRYRHHPTHMTVDQALEQIENIKPKRSFLTHIAHDISHRQLSDDLPENVQVAYDGLKVKL